MNPESEEPAAGETHASDDSRFRALIENDAAGIALSDEYSNVIYRSPGGKKIIGDEQSENSINRTHPDDLELIKSKQIETLSKPGVPIPFQGRFLHASGHYIWLEGTFTNMLHVKQIHAIVTNYRDITERKEAENKLQNAAERESLFASIVNSSDDAIISKTLDGVITSWNRGAETIFGYSEKEAIGNNVSMIIPSALMSEELEIIAKIRQGVLVRHYETERLRKDGSSIMVSLTISPIIDTSNVVIGASKIARDITKRKNEEFQRMLLANISRLFNEPADLKLTLERVLEKLLAFGDFKIAEAWLISTDTQKIALVANLSKTELQKKFYAESQGLRSFFRGDGLPGITWKSNKIVYCSADEDRFVRKNAANKAGIQTVLGVPIMYGDEVIGAFVFGLDKKDPIPHNRLALFDQLGTYAGADIRRKQMEQELNQMFSLAPDIICTAGLDGYFKKINPAACDLLGYSEKELLAVPFVEFIHPDDQDISREQINTLKNGTITSHFENRFITKSGAIRWLAWTATPSPEDELIFGVARDITDKKNLEILLHKANSLAQLGSWEMNMKTGSVYWSGITREIFEVERDFEPSLETSINFYEEGPGRDMILHRVQEAIDTGEPWDLELQIRTEKGNEKWVRAIGEAEFQNGECVLLNGSVQDIDIRKKAEIELKKSMKVLEDYMFALDESSIIAITDNKGVILSINDNFCKISKYDREELVGNTHRIVNSGFHPKAFFTDIWRTIASGRTWRGEIKNKTKDGEYYWVYTTITPFLDKNNKPFQYLAIRFDITEKKRAEEALLGSLKEKEMILESIGNAFFAVDKNWMVTYWNSQAEKILHKSKQEIVGSNLWEVFSDSIASRSYKKYHEAIETGQVIHFEDYYTPLEAWYEISAYPSEYGLSVYFKDVTERKHSEIKLRELNGNLLKQAKALATSNAELEQFAYVASHDMQEPLRMITSFLSQLEKKYGDIIDSKGKRYIEFAVDGARRMRQIILDLLEFSRVGRQMEEEETVDLNELMDEIQILYCKQIEVQHAEIHFEKLPVVNGHKTPLRQIFQNLVSNSLKYAKPDVATRIEISAADLTTHWQFSVSDNGIGISEEYFDKIFVIFQRLHNKDQYSGTGMGLAIAKKIVENRGGRIWLESKQEEGSTFYFTLLK